MHCVIGIEYEADCVIICMLYVTSRVINCHIFSHDMFYSLDYCTVFSRIVIVIQSMLVLLRNNTRGLNAVCGSYGLLAAKRGTQFLNNYNNIVE